MAEITTENFWKKGYIRLSSAACKDEICGLLIKQGYTPRFVRKKLAGSKNYSYFVEYRYKPIDLSDDDILD